MASLAVVTGDGRTLDLPLALRWPGPETISAATKDIAGFGAWLASDEAGYAAGAILQAGGGL